MKKELRVLIISFVLSGFVVANAQTADHKEGETAVNHANTSLLWKIEGNGLEKTSYLFGTIHIIPKDSFYVDTTVYPAMEASERLVLEMVLDMPALAKSAMGIMMPPGQSLKKLLGDDDYDYLSAVISDSLKMPIPFFQMIKPIFLSQQISASYCLKGVPASYELFFMERYKEMKKPVSGLETVEQQLSFFDNLSLEEQAKELMETARTLPEICEMYSEMFHLYRTQDLSLLMGLVNEDQSLDEIREDILTNRNKEWIDQLNEMMKDQALFIAVGAAHLPGEGGVIQLLKEEGYTLNPIPAIGL